MRTALVSLVLVWMVACGPGKGSTNGGGDDEPDPVVDAPVVEIDAPSGPGAVAPGGACSCDADCASEGANAGVCIYGVCMTRATAACASAGSQGECAAGSRCWSLDGVDG
ncbi:MAG: hypothetical protein H0X17_16735, partial [Deltaproteobacteria bacterium]|nr:hypothetical protein [Deltaproteobacteria bacterium]